MSSFGCTDGAASLDAGNAQPRAAMDAGRKPRRADAAVGGAAVSDAGGVKLPPWKAPLPAATAPACPSARFHPTDDDDAGTEAAKHAPLELRPQLGAFSEDSMRLWLRAETDTDVCVEYWPQGHPELSKTALGPQLRASSDFTGTLSIGSLQPATRYDYRLWLAGADAKLVREDARDASFTTAPALGKPARVRFVWGADVTGTRRQPIFASMKAQRPDFAILLGDLMYTDSLKPTAAAYRNKAHKNWSILQLAELASSVPMLAMWDDHDIMDNYWPGRDDARYAAARQAFDEYDAARNPAPVQPGELYFVTRVAELDVFVLDVRTHRSANTLSDGPSKSMLGATQRDALFAWLAGSKARVKIIASPVLFADHSETHEDAWTAFANEREQIFYFIVQHHIDDVLLISGDQHWTAVFKLVRDEGRYTFYELQATPLSKEPVALPALRGDDVVAKFGSQGVFGVVDVDTRVSPTRIALTVCVGGRPCDAGNEPTPVPGKAPFTLHLTSDDLGFE